MLCVMMVVISLEIDVIGWMVCVLWVSSGVLELMLSM